MALFVHCHECSHGCARPEVRYLQLARNVWDPHKRRSTVQVVCNFGREDTENREALQR